MNIELGKNISSREIETRIQEFWDKNNFWDNDVKSEKTPFCIMVNIIVIICKIRAFSVSGMLYKYFGAY